MDKKPLGKIGYLQHEIGNRLKALRIDNGLTQKELAAKVKGGVDYTYIGKIERGRQLPSLKILVGLSETLSVPIDFFFRDEPETIVYVNGTAEFGFLLKDEKGRDLLKALKLLQPRDIPLIMEIIRILARHGNIDNTERPAAQETPAEEFLPVAEKKAPYLEK